MKKILFSAMALSIAFGGAVAAKTSAPKFAKTQWLLKPGKTGADALNPTAYTHASISGCNGEITLCGITATATAGGQAPNLTADAALNSDLTSIAGGDISNNSHEVKFKDL